MRCSSPKRGEDATAGTSGEQQCTTNKAIALALGDVPGQEAFIRPWMIDRANDPCALAITRARTLLGWETKGPLRETLPKMAVLKADPLGSYCESTPDPPGWLQQRAGRTAEGGSQ